MLTLETDVLIIGGGMAAGWAAISAARSGADVVLVDKGYVGSSGVTATGGPGHWWVPPDPKLRRETVERRMATAYGLADPDWMARIIETTWDVLPSLAKYYDFPTTNDGKTHYQGLRGPEYVRALRLQALDAGVRIFDQCPALELLLHADGAAAGAQGVQRLTGEPWRIRAGSVIMATGGCAFRSGLLGSHTNTGDGYLMAAEAGAKLSGMEFSSHYTIAPAFSTMARGMSYVYATYYGADKNPLDLPKEAGRNRALARAMLEGPVYCDLALMPQDIRDRLPTISPNVLPPFERRGINPFTNKFPVLLLAEGTIRGMGGIQVEDQDCQTAVPGLYAAGDAASRELVTGAISGGGSVNSAWALSSGTWAGRAAARRAHATGPRADDPADALGQAGLRPRRAGGVEALEVIETARHEAIHYDRNYFRTEEKLTRSLSLLAGLWEDVKAGVSGDVVRAREAASITASARWSFTAALHRRESRGMHARIDFPALDQAFESRQVLTGIERIHSSFEHIAAVRELVA
jgi:succinate dehydrogenase/fumarate reductase flavoprotein subunit